MRTLTSKKGLVVNTDLPDEQALAITGALRTNRFAQELASRHRQNGKLTDDQWAWVHKMALEATGKADQIKLAEDSVLNLLPIYALVKQGHKGGGFPLLRVSMEPHDNRILYIGLKSGATSLNSWQVQIRAGTWGEEGNYYGRIDSLGVFYRAKECDDKTVEFLKTLAAKPAVTLATAGRAAGKCPLCGQDLTNAASQAHGYGHACAVRFQLPWAGTQS